MKTFKMMSILAIFFACFISSCSKDESADNPLLGYWYSPSDKDSIVFLEDGKAVWYDAGCYGPYKYTYDPGSGFLVLYRLLDDFYSYSEVNWDSEIDDDLGGEFMVKIEGKTAQLINPSDGEVHYTFIKVDKFPYKED